jgi:hypothetical protein
MPEEKFFIAEFTEKTEATERSGGKKREKWGQEGFYLKTEHLLG